jgi:hypothetical protein
VKDRGEEQKKIEKEKEKAPSSLAWLFNEEDL